MGQMGQLGQSRHYGSSNRLHDVGLVCPRDLDRETGHVDVDGSLGVVLGRDHRQIDPIPQGPRRGCGF